MQPVQKNGWWDQGLKSIYSVSIFDIFQNFYKK